MDVKPKVVQVPKTQVILPAPQLPAAASMPAPKQDEEDAIRKDLDAFTKMRRSKCPKCDIWDPKESYCTMGITISDAPMGKCPEFVKIAPVKPLPLPVPQKQEIAVPVSEVSSLLKMARIKTAHHVPKCPKCGNKLAGCKPSFTWDGRMARITTTCGAVLDWDPSPSWLVILKVEKWLNGL